MYTLLRKHRHQTKKSNLRSLADIGKTVSSASRLFSNQENGNTDASVVQSTLLFETFHLQWSEEEEKKTGKKSPGAELEIPVESLNPHWSLNMLYFLSLTILWKLARLDWFLTNQIVSL